MLGPGLVRSPQLLRAMAWLVGAKKVADRHSSPSSSAGQYTCETGNILLLCPPSCCMAPHAPGGAWLIASRHAPGGLQSQQLRDSLAGFLMIISSAPSDWTPLNHAPSCLVEAVNLTHHTHSLEPAQVQHSSGCEIRIAWLACHEMQMA